MSKFDMPEVLLKNVGMWAEYGYRDGSNRINSFCLKFGEDRVWVFATQDDEGTPILKFTHRHGIAYLPKKDEDNDK